MSGEISKTNKSHPPMINYPNNLNPPTDWVKVLKIDFNDFKPIDFMGFQKEYDIKISQEQKVFNDVKSMVCKIVPDASDEFVKSAIEIANDLKCNPTDFASLIYIESKFDPKQVKGGFKGLGQMRAAAFNHAKDYINSHPEYVELAEKNGVKFKSGLTFDDFTKLPREEQIFYVGAYSHYMKDAYIKPADKAIDGGTLYGLFLAPGNINNKYLISKESSTYKGNINLDINKNDGGITISDLETLIKMTTEKLLSRDSVRI